MCADHAKTNHTKANHTRATSAIDWPRILLQACRRIESADSVPTLPALATMFGVSASELQRQFRRRLGISPHAYGRTLRLHRLTCGIATAETALDAVFAAGYESVTSAYANAASSLGAAPGKLRRPIDIDCWLGLSDLGWMLMAATDKGICWLTFGDHPEAMLQQLQAAFPQARWHDGELRLAAWFDAVREHILLPREALALPMDIQGTAFQTGVWNVLRKIPLGATLSYTEVAQRLGNKQAVRAVASACASNKLALLIPCHRVLAANGKLAGYRWGVTRKATMLEREHER